MEFQYDIALSFAGEDRNFVKTVAATLRGQGIKVFFDEFEEHQLWGEDLYQRLSKVYREQARFVVIFISRHYAKKVWTNHELRSAQARAFAEKTAYILPARFDDTELPGILPTVGYIDLRKVTLEDFVPIIVAKLRDYLPPSIIAGAANIGRAEQSLNVPHRSMCRVTVFKGNPHYKLYCDNSLIGEFGADGFLRFELVPGRHSLQLKYDGGIHTDGRGIEWSRWGESEIYSFDFIDAEYYFECGMPFWQFGNFLPSSKTKVRLYAVGKKPRQ